MVVRPVACQIRDEAHDDDVYICAASECACGMNSSIYLWTWLWNVGLGMSLIRHGLLTARSVGGQLSIGNALHVLSLSPTHPQPPSQPSHCSVQRYVVAHSTRTDWQPPAYRPYKSPYLQRPRHRNPCSRHFESHTGPANPSVLSRIPKCPSIPCAHISRSPTSLTSPGPFHCYLSLTVPSGVIRGEQHYKAPLYLVSGPWSRPASHSINAHEHPAQTTQRAAATGRLRCYQAATRLRTSVETTPSLAPVHHPAVPAVHDQYFQLGCRCRLKQRRAHTPARHGVPYQRAVSMAP